MKNDNSHSHHSRSDYNPRWDSFADRDRYEREYYQNRSHTPRGNRKEGEDRYGHEDRYRNRVGSGYRSGNTERSNRYGNGYGYYGSERKDFNRDDRNYDYDRRNRNNPNYDSDRNWWDRTTDEVASWFGDEDAENRRDNDLRQDQRGKGPKGYQRSDEKIKADLEDELYDDSYIDASDIMVTVKAGIVNLSGSVDSKWIKRRTEDLAETVRGVKDVTDNLIIRKDTKQNPNDFYRNSESDSGDGKHNFQTESQTGRQ